MGYFFRPRFPNADYLYNNKELLLAFAKEWDAKNNRYSFAGCMWEGKLFAHWRFWGWFIHDPHYKDFIDRLFIVVKDPTEESDYEGDCIWRRRFNGIYNKDGKKKVKGNGFNKNYSDAYTLKECNKAFKILKQLVIEDKNTNYSDEPEFFADLKQSLKYIMFSRWEDYEAY